MPHYAQGLRGHGQESIEEMEGHSLQGVDISGLLLSTSLIHGKIHPTLSLSTCVHTWLKMAALKPSPSSSQPNNCVMLQLLEQNSVVSGLGQGSASLMESWKVSVMHV